MQSNELRPFRLNRPDPDVPDDEQAYLEAMASLRHAHNQWRGMMRLALWASVLALLFARLNSSQAALVIALAGFAFGLVAFVKSWRIRRKMIRRRDQHEKP